MPEGGFAFDHGGMTSFCFIIGRTCNLHFVRRMPKSPFLLHQERMAFSDSGSRGIPGSAFLMQFPNSIRDLYGVFSRRSLSPSDRSSRAQSPPELLLKRVGCNPPRS